MRHIGALLALLSIASCFAMVIAFALSGGMG